jgi:hypothetical protein
VRKYEPNWERPTEARTKHEKSIMSFTTGFWIKIRDLLRDEDTEEKILNSIERKW